MKRQPTMLLILALFILIISCGYFYYQYEKKIIHQEKYSDLKTIADLKINQIVQWRRGRLADAHVIAESPLIRLGFHRWLLSQDSTLTKDLLESFSLLKYNRKYQDVFVVPAEGKHLLGLNPNFKHIDSETIDYCKIALQDKETFLSDFYFSPVHNTILFDIFAPILNDRNVSVAVIVLRVNPYDYLYPLFQYWPTSSKSAETLIIRRDGDSILYLNELRHISNTALKLRIPLSSIEVPAVQAVLGKTGVFEGLDYRGIKVLADIRPVPGTPWFMIAKVDQSEIFSELRYRTVIVIIITLLLLLFSGIGISLLYNNRQKNIYRKLIETGTALKDSQEEFRTTLYSIGDAVITTDIKGCIRNMNTVAEKLTGWKEPDVVGRTLDEVFNIINEDSRDKVESPVQKVLKEGLVAGLANHTLLISKEGIEIPIADSGAPIRNEKGDITGVVLVFRDQTNERAAQKALRESERKFRETVKYLDEGYYSATTDGFLIDHNQAYNLILGIDKTSELKGQKTPDFWQDLEDRTLYINELMTHGSIRNYVVDARKINGEKIVVLMNSHLVKDENDNPVRIEGTFTDFTKLRQAEDTIRTSEARLRAILDATPFPIAIVDIQDNIIDFWSSSALTLFGHTAPTVAEWYQLAYPDPDYRNEVIGRWKPFLEKARSTGQVVSTGEYQITCHDRSVRICELYAAFIADDLIVIFNDITERVQNMKELEHHRSHLEQLVADRTADLKKSEEKFRTVADFAYNWEYWIDADRRMLYVSPSCECITGFMPVSFYEDPQFIDTIIHPDDRQIYQKHVESHHRKNDTDESCEIEFRIIAKNGGMKWIGHLCTPVVGNNGAYLGRRVSNRDVTENKNAENEIVELNAVLTERSAKLEASNKELEAFSYSVSHDLRAPLRHVGGYVELLNKHFHSDLPEKGQHYLNSIAESVHLMGRLIDDLLSFSRTGRMEMHHSDFDMDEIVKEVIESLRLDNPDREIEWTVGKLPSVIGDESMLRLVWINLLSNAVKFTRPRKKARIEIGGSKESKEHVFYVRDNGVGFDMQYAQKLFGVFQRLHPIEEFEGTGIGLANVNRTISRHGGRTWAEAEPGKGAVFYFSIPNDKEGK